ncbi:AAA family ATPase [Thalassotalea sp. M1531]|uniref:DNA-directed DNA polymerase n=1 Tax=Thalassotalea algicola TaxID=2716224 RepID=A0A7Y0LBL1_9GAMM|nr:AAA family ATPase [Thalassotalea algicola]NMP31421.1 AAA family ATPase [Thalassotalea algicola]
MHNEEYSWLAPHQSRLSTQIKQQKLPHALLITGAKGAGKSRLANWLSQTIQCQQIYQDQTGVLLPCGVCKHCQLQKSQTFPDIVVIEEADSTISVDNIRAVTRFFETKSQIAQRKVVLINTVENMTVSAANALLKTLEEPNEGNLLILTTEHLEHLLPTIISRCQRVELRPQLEEQFTQGTLSEPYANTSYLPELKDSEVQQAYRTFLDAFIQCLTNPAGIISFEQQLNSSERTLIWLERIVTHLMRAKSGWQTPQELAEEYNLAANKLDNDSLLAIFQLILAANKQVKEYSQVNSAMLKQQLIVDLAEIIAGIES